MKSLRKDKRGVQNLLSIVLIAISALVFAILFPIVMSSITGAVTTGACAGFPNNTTTIANLPKWCSQATGTVFNVLFPILVVIGAVLLIAHELRTEGGAASLLRNDRRGASPLLALVFLAIAALVFAILFPIIMQQIVAPTTTLWGSAVTTVFQTLFPVLVVIVVVLKFIHKPAEQT